MALVRPRKCLALSEGDFTAGLESRDAFPSSPAPRGSGPPARPASLLSVSRAACPGWQYEFHMNGPRWGQLGSQLGPLPMVERGPHPGLSNHPGPNFREFPGPLPAVPDAPAHLIRFSHMPAFPCLTPSPPLLSNIRNPRALQRAARVPLDAGV